MTGQPRDLEWPTRRWLLWGLIAVVVLALIVLLFVWFSGEETTPAEEAAEEGTGPQVEWSIDLVDQTGNTVTLKGDLPAGITTETWVDDSRLIRDPSGTFEWDMNAELPVAVVQIDNAGDCAALNAELDQWVGEIGAATADPQRWQARAFTQHALDTMRVEGCELDEATLASIVDGS